MDSYRSRAGMGTDNSEASAWRCVGFHAMVVWEIINAITVSSPHNAIYSSPAVSHWVEGFEKEVYESSNDKEEYVSNMAKWIVSMNSLSQIPGRRPLANFFGPSGRASSSSGGDDKRNTYIKWQEELYSRVQKLTSMFSSKYPNWCRLAIILNEQRDSAPQHLMIPHVMISNMVMRFLEMVVHHLYLTRGHVSPYYKAKLDGLEKLIIYILRPKKVSSVPSQSGGSQGNLSEVPLTTPQSYSHLSKRKATESEVERPNKLMKRETIEYIFFELKHETPGETSKEKEDDDDDFDSAGLDLSLKL